MNRETIASIVAQELDSFEYAPANDTIGTPWSAERISGEVAKLRAWLIAPEKRGITRHPPEAPTESIQELWVVAVTDDNFVLFYDPALQEFGLALQGQAGPPVSIGVYGDLVGTFCSR